MQELHLCDCDPSHSEGDNNAISFIIYNSLASVSERMQCSVLLSSRVLIRCDLRAILFTYKDCSGGNKLADF